MTNLNNNEEEIKHVFQIEPDGSITPMALRKGSAVAELPGGVFSLNWEKDRGLFLKPENDFKLPKRVYGNVDVHVDRFLRSYELNDKNLGVMLIGTSGSGKTLTLKALVQKAIPMHFPVILINEPYTGDALVHFLSTITQPCVVCFDEFEKIYSKPSENPHNPANTSAQRTILQLLDGASTGAKKLFMFTANDERDISPYLRERPSRIRYWIEFKNLEDNTVIDYVRANLVNLSEEHLRAFISLAKDVRIPRPGMNFDSMRELVNEMNQFREDLGTCVKVMLPSMSETHSTFEVTVEQEGEETYTVIGTGIHQGPYIGKSPSKITLASWETLRERWQGRGEEECTTPRVLTEKDFYAFGENINTVIFKQENIIFTCKYTSRREINQRLEFMEKEKELKPLVNAKCDTGEGEDTVSSSALDTTQNVPVKSGRRWRVVPGNPR